jgi:hypothetical protein
MAAQTFGASEASVGADELYRSLRDLHAKHGPREFGKIVQKLLALTFRLAGFERIVERGVQGVDVDAASELGERYAIEVKTTQSRCISFGPKDRDGLQARERDGYRPLLGILRLSPLSDLLLIHPATLPCRRLRVASLGPYRFRELEGRLQPWFAVAVQKHFEGTYAGSQYYLDGQLRKHDIEVRDLPYPWSRRR